MRRRIAAGRGQRLGAPRPGTQSGFSLIEVLIVMAIVGLIGVLAVPAYTQHVDRARVAAAVADVKQLEMTLERFRTQNGLYPDDLAEIGQDDLADPWGNPYRYLHLAPFVVGGRVTGAVLAQSRKDENLVPINSDFDLYSVGKDGATRVSISHLKSRDDIVRGGNGGYVGLAEDY